MSVQLRICSSHIAACVGSLSVPGTDPGVLVGGDGRERSLWEGEGLENTPADAEQVVCLDDVEARVVAMHGVQNDLKKRGIQFRLIFTVTLSSYSTSIHFIVNEELEIPQKKPRGIIWKYKVVV